MKIVAVEVRAVGEEHGWSFYSEDESLRSTLTICRILTACGLEGVGGVTQYSEHAFDHTSATYLRDHLAPKLLGRDPRMREQIMGSMASDVYPAPPHAQAAVDIALWDCLGNASGTPLYMLLGGSKTSLPVQWSSPSLATVQEYLDWASDAVKEGCRRIKIHGFMNWSEDRVLVAALKAHLPADVLLSLDVENRYSHGDAVKMAKLLGELDYEWFEAPLPDRDLGRYADLTRRSDVDILPAGNSLTDLQSFADGCARGCWGRARFDVTVCGGITQAKKYFAVAEAYGLRTEVQSWGHTLTAAANLHVMLGLGGARLGSSHFELAVPRELYEVGMKDVLEFVKDGGGQLTVHPPNSAERPGGLGVRVDWVEMDRLAFFNQRVVVEEEEGQGHPHPPKDRSKL
jgi:L-alanine-DL-glutamate epimerase-like enolase superfamily enzyme